MHTAVRPLVTIDHERGVYVVRSKDRIQTAPYSSRETAARVAEFYRWRGWEVRIVGESQNHGDSKVTTDKARQIEESLVKTLWRIDAFGTEKADGRSLRGLRKRGLIDERGGITAAGRELMAGYSQFALQTPDEWLNEPQEEELSEVKVTAPEPEPVRRDVGRETLKAVRAGLLRSVKGYLPKDFQGVVDEIERINDVLEG
jgi:hypothetical protein